MKRLAAMLGMVAALVAAPVMAADKPADALVKDVSQEVLSILKKDKSLQAGDRKKLYDLVETKVLPHFDFDKMTQMAVGKYWRTATPEQKKQLVDQFRTLLVRTYSVSLANYKNQTIDYKPLSSGQSDDRTVVSTVINQPGGQPIPVDYTLARNGSGWKVYDIAVEGVSLVTTYRGEFSSQVRQGGVDGLIKALADKNAK